MFIYERNIIKNIVLYFLPFTFVVIAPSIMVKTLKYVYLLNDFSIFLYLFSQIYLLIPLALFFIIPCINCLAIAYVYRLLHKQKQIIALYNAGLSNFHIARPALLFSAVISLICFYITFYLNPIISKKFIENLNNIEINSDYLTIIPEKTFFSVTKSFTFYIESKINQKAHNIIIIQNNYSQLSKRQNESSLINSIFGAESASFLKEGNRNIIILYNGWQHYYDKKTTKGHMLKFASFVIELPDFKKFLNNNYKDSSNYSFNELFINNKQLPKAERIKLRLEGHQRIAWSLYSFLLPCIFLAFFLKMEHNRSLQIKEEIKITLIIVIYIFLHFAIYNISMKEPSFIFALYFNIICGLLISFKKLLTKS